MQSKKLFSLKKLKEELKKCLKDYKNIVEDIIIFGSSVKQKSQPNDIDIAIIMKEKDYDVVHKINHYIGSKIDISIHTTPFLFKEIYTEPVWKSLISEGFSIKKNKFLKDVVHIDPIEIISYKLKELTPSEKTQFNRGFNEVMNETHSFKIGPGSVAIPEENSWEFEDFFDNWKKVKKKRYKTLFL